MGATESHSPALTTLKTTTYTGREYKPSTDANVLHRHVVSIPRDTLRTTHHVHYPPRLFTPEPTTSGLGTLDKYRRYSTAGNLDLYRPAEKYQTQVVVERSEPRKVSFKRISFAEPLVTYNWTRPTGPHCSQVRDHPTDQEPKKEEELRVKSRTDGPITSYYVSSLPVEAAHRAQSARPSVGSQPVTNAGRALKESRKELEDFERLMTRTFGRGGTNTAPSYYYPYSSTSGYVPYYSSYSSPYYYSPYYRGTVTSILDTLPDYYVSSAYTRPYSYHSLKPSDYEYRHSMSTSSYPVGGYSSVYYNPSSSVYDRYPSRYRTYSVVR